MTLRMDAALGLLLIALTAWSVADVIVCGGLRGWGFFTDGLVAAAVVDYCHRLVRRLLRARSLTRRAEQNAA